MNFFNKFFSKKKKISNQPLTEGKLVTDESLKKSVSKEISNTDLKESIIEAKSIDVVDETTNNKTDKVLVNTKKESLNKGLKISSQSFFSKISKAIIGKSKVNDEVLDDLEEILISSDVGVKTTLKIIDRIENRVAKDKYISTDELDLILKEEIISIISDDEESVNNLIVNKNNNPHVILIVGVNGAGKTTSIGKMANYYKSLGLKVVIGAADTFRAAAIEQLEVWANRVKVDLIKQEMGSDPASVAFDTLESAIKKDADIVLIDTAGRLHNKVNLMNELSKIKRVLKKKAFDAPNEVILVIDGSTGQNAFEQAKQFTKVTEITSLIITKLDGTAKGGVVLGISDQFQIPIKFVGVGEKIEDLQIFDKKEFVDSFFKKS
jgi:fused signal recognition particle receptor